MSNLSHDELNALNELVQVGDGYSPVVTGSLSAIHLGLHQKGMVEVMIGHDDDRGAIVQLTALGRRTILAMG